MGICCNKDENKLTTSQRVRNEKLNERFGSNRSSTSENAQSETLFEAYRKSQEEKFVILTPIAVTSSLYEDLIKDVEDDVMIYDCEFEEKKRKKKTKKNKTQPKKKPQITSSIEPQMVGTQMKPPPPPPNKKYCPQIRNVLNEKQKIDKNNKIEKFSTNVRTPPPPPPPQMKKNFETEKQQTKNISPKTGPPPPPPPFKNSNKPQMKHLEPQIDQKNISNDLKDKETEILKIQSVKEVLQIEIGQTANQISSESTTNKKMQVELQIKNLDSIDIQPENILEKNIEMKAHAPDKDNKNQISKHTVISLEPNTEKLIKIEDQGTKNQSIDTKNKMEEPVKQLLEKKNISESKNMITEAQKIDAKSFKIIQTIEEKLNEVEKSKSLKLEIEKTNEESNKFENSKPTNQFEKSNFPTNEQKIPLKHKV